MLVQTNSLTSVTDLRIDRILYYYVAFDYHMYNSSVNHLSDSLSVCQSILSSLLYVYLFIAMLSFSVSSISISLFYCLYTNPLFRL